MTIITEFHKCVAKMGKSRVIVVPKKLTEGLMPDVLYKVTISTSDNVSPICNKIEVDTNEHLQEARNPV